MWHFHGKVSFFILFFLPFFLFMALFFFLLWVLTQTIAEKSKLLSGASWRCFNFLGKLVGKSSIEGKICCWDKDESNEINLGITLKFFSEKYLISFLQNCLCVTDFSGKKIFKSFTKLMGWVIDFHRYLRYLIEWLIEISHGIGLPVLSGFISVWHYCG